MQDGAGKAEGNHLATTEVHQQRDSRFHAHTFSMEGAVIRNQVCVNLAGEGAECKLNGLYLNDGERLIHNALLLTHAVPHCSSRIAYKGILGRQEPFRVHRQGERAAGRPR